MSATDHLGPQWSDHPSRDRKLIMDSSQTYHPERTPEKPKSKGEFRRPPLDSAQEWASAMWATSQLPKGVAPL